MLPQTSSMGLDICIAGLSLAQIERWDQVGCNVKCVNPPPPPYSWSDVNETATLFPLRNPSTMSILQNMVRSLFPTSLKSCMSSPTHQKQYQRIWGNRCTNKKKSYECKDLHTAFIYFCYGTNPHESISFVSIHLVHKGYAYRVRKRYACINLKPAESSFPSDLISSLAIN